MDQNSINITYHEGRGRMTVVLDEFFPAGAARLQKLLKIIDEDCERRDELRATITQHCGQRAQALMDSRKDLASWAVNYHTKATELQPEIDRLARQAATLQRYIEAHCRRGRGQSYRQQLKGIKAQLESAKKQRLHALTLFRDYQRQFISAEKVAGRLRKNMEAADHEG